MAEHSQFALLRQRRFLPYFLVQALGAFNDNVFRQAIVGLLGYMAIAQADRGMYTQLAPAVFILPYFLFSATAGQIAEKLEKARLIRITTAMEIAIMSLAAVGFLLQDMRVLLAALFATGVQSTLFGPVKYSILPAVLKPEELTGGNGLVEMGTSISILLGMLYGGLIFAVAGTAGPVAAGVSVIVLAIIGNLLSRRIPPVPAAAPDLRVQWNPIPESLKVWRITRRQQHPHVLQQEAHRRQRHDRDLHRGGDADQPRLLHALGELAGGGGEQEVGEDEDRRRQLREHPAVGLVDRHVAEQADDRLAEHVVVEGAECLHQEVGQEAALAEQGELGLGHCVACSPRDGPIVGARKPRPRNPPSHLPTPRPPRAGVGCRHGRTGPHARRLPRPRQPDERAGAEPVHRGVARVRRLGAAPARDPDGLRALVRGHDRGDRDAAAENHP